MGIHSPDANINVAYLAMLACSNASKSMSEQQIADATTTINYGKLEDSINELWYGPNAQSSSSTPDPQAGFNNLQQCINEINTYAGAGDLQNNPGYAEWTTAYQAAVARAQAATSKADSLMQMSNSQTNTDSTNIQNVMQLASMMNFLGYVANLLARG